MDRSTALLTGCVLLVVGTTASAQARVKQPLLCPAEEHPVRAWEAPELTRLLAEARYEDLEQALDARREAGRDEGNYTTQVDSALIRLVVADNIEQVRQWADARKSAWSYLVLGRTLIKYAWAARGSGYARTVTDQGWKLFGERLQEAQTALEKAEALEPGWPEAPGYLVTVARGLDLPKAEEKKRFERAVAADPLYWPAYRNRMVGLQPRWGGSVAAMQKFARESRARSDDPMTLRVELMLHEEFNFQAPGRYFKQQGVFEKIDLLVDQLVEAYPACGFPRAFRSDAASAVNDVEQWLEDVRALTAAHHSAGTRQLAHYLLTRDPKPESKRLGVRHLCRAAHYGDGQAQLMLGQALAKGSYGLKVDPFAAVEWYGKAALALDRDDLVITTFNSYLNLRNFDKAKEWARIGSDRGIVNCQATHGKNLWDQGEYEEATRLLMSAAKKRDPTAYFYLGEIHKKTDRFKEAADCYRAAVMLRLGPARSALKKLLEEHPELRQAGDP